MLKVVVGAILVVIVMVKVVVFVGFAAGVEKRLHIGNNSQEMTQCDDYKDFLKSNLKKADLIRRLNEFMKREVPRLHLDFLLVIALEEEEWGISLTEVQSLSPCNHEEADNCIMYHSFLEDKPTVVITSDTDILIIRVHVFASRLLDHNWLLQTKKKAVCECI